MAKIYRIENRNTSKGPYLGRVPIDCTKTDKHPAPYDDIGIDHWRDSSYNNYRYGFSSLEQLLEWFYDELEILKEHNYTCHIYEVQINHIRYGSKQVAFDFDKKQFIDEIPL